MTTIQELRTNLSRNDLSPHITGIDGVAHHHREGKHLLIGPLDCLSLLGVLYKM